jgi:hypothetical protein
MAAGVAFMATYLRADVTRWSSQKRRQARTVGRTFMAILATLWLSGTWKSGGYGWKFGMLLLVGVAGEAAIRRFIGATAGRVASVVLTIALWIAWFAGW